MDGRQHGRRAGRAGSSSSTSFTHTTLHNADIRAGKLREKYDAIILPDQAPRSIIDGANGQNIRPEYRGGIGDEGVAALRAFVAQGGTLITLGDASDLAIERFGVPLREPEERPQPRRALRAGHDPQHRGRHQRTRSATAWRRPRPASTTTARSSRLLEGFSSQKLNVIARYPNANVVASGWLKGEELMSGRAAVVSVDTNPGRIVLFGLRPQHRAQTHATFPLLFNALYLSASDTSSKPATVP